jgi:hypothetical protein
LLLVVVGLPGVFWVLAGIDEEPSDCDRVIHVSVVRGRIGRGLRYALKNKGRL